MKATANQSGRLPSVRRLAFTLVELLVVIMIIIILAGILMPSLQAARIQMLRSKCGNNLRSIGQACQAYCNDATKHRGGTGDVLPSADAGGSYGWNSTPRSLWLLLDHEMVGREYFLCPEAELRRDFKAPAEADIAFTATTCSYAYLAQRYPVPGQGDKYATTPSIDLYGGMIILADDNPQVNFGGGSAGAASKLVNSENHDGDGQNIADLTGSVRWVQSPVIKVTSDRSDNIYVQGDNGSAGGPSRNAVGDVYVID